MTRVLLRLLSVHQSDSRWGGLSPFPTARRRTALRLKGVAKSSYWAGNRVDHPLSHLPGCGKAPLDHSFCASSVPN